MLAADVAAGQHRAGSSGRDSKRPAFFPLLLEVLLRTTCSMSHYNAEPKAKPMIAPVCICGFGVGALGGAQVLSGL